jgi:hypothetical protein
MNSLSEKVTLSTIYDEEKDTLDDFEQKGNSNELDGEREGQLSSICL